MPLHLHILHGANQGQRVAPTGSPVTFGRDPQATIVLDLPYASRQHAELVEEAGVWRLVNHSPNGTRVNRQNVRKQSGPLRHGDVILIGDVPVLRVSLVAGPTGTDAAPGATDAGDEEAPVAAAPAPASGMSKKTKLWAGIGIYLLACLVGMVFLTTLQDKDDGPAPAAAELSREQIEAEITKPLPKAMHDPRKVQEHLLAATQLYQRLDPAGRNLHQIYRHYQLALAHSETPTFSQGLDQRRFQDVEAQLVKLVSDKYKQAYAMLRARQYREAIEAFSEVNALYPNPGGLLARNIQQQQKAAQENLRKRR